MLEQILENKRSEVARRQQLAPLREVERLAAAAPPPRPFSTALRGERIRLIAEIKKVSPARGSLKVDMDPADQAMAYARGGAAALSVLTDQRFFRGSDEDLRRARETVSLPVLRKDFVVSEYQVFEARAIGADAVLLIVRALAPDELRRMLRLARELGLAALTEVHDEDELTTALEAGAELIGINNRDLTTMAVDLGTTLRLLPRVPAEVTVVSESGIHDRQTVVRLEEAGAHAILVGEALVLAADPAAKVAELLGTGPSET